MKIYVGLGILILLSLNFVSADIYSDCDIYGTCVDTTGNITKYINETNNYFTYNYSGAIFNYTTNMSYDNLVLNNQSNNFANFSLTDVGQLVMTGIITSQDIIPLTDNIYSVGNSSKWFKDVYSKNIYGENVNATNMTSTNINSTNIGSENIDSENINSGNVNSTNINSTNVKTENVNTSNLTIGGYEVKEKNGSLVIQI